MLTFNQRRRGILAGANLGFWAGGMNIFFNEDMYNAFRSAVPGAYAELATQARLAELGITNTGDSPGTYFDSAGVMRTKAGTEPRLNWVDGKLDSLLVEPTAINRATFSTDLMQPVWYASAGATKSTGPLAPDAVTYLTNITFAPDSNGYSGFGGASISITAGAAITLSCYVKGTPGNFIRIGIYGENGGALSNNIPVTSTLSRVSATVIAPVDGSFNVRLWNGSNNLIHTIQAWGYQPELGSALTSFIPTSNVAVARVASLIRQPAASLPGFSSARGTWLSQFVASGTTASGRIIADAVGGNLYAGLLSNGLDVGIFDGATVVATRISQTSPLRLACAYSNQNGVAMVSANGGTAVTGAFSNALLNPSTISYGGFGSGSGLPIAAIRRISYSPIIASAAELQAISAGLL